VKETLSQNQLYEGWLARLVPYPASRGERIELSEVSLLLALSKKKFADALSDLDSLSSA